MLFFYLTDGDPHSAIKITDTSIDTHTQDSLDLDSGSVYVAVAKAFNGANLITSSETTGVRVDPTPPEVSII